jgi:homoserine dehydrogenase
VNPTDQNAVEKTRFDNPGAVRVGIVGLGTVGSGVARLLINEAERLRRHAGCELQLARVVVRDLGKPRDCQLPDGTLSNDIAKIAEDEDIDVVAQLMGGIEPARSVMVQLLESGKDVVTANKALLAEHGPELFDRARQLGRCIAFEASVAGGIPIIANLCQCLSANQIISLCGILNGTSNFILSQMEECGADYDAAVSEAQQRGFAEADPAMDVDGTDAAQKLAILAHLAFGARVNWADIPRNGIDSLETIDLRFASELGYRIKLLAIAQLADGSDPNGGLDLHVSPTLVPVGTPLSDVHGANNAISVVGDAVGTVFYEGLGAGQMPTASAVVADLVDTAVGRAQLTFRTVRAWSNREPLVQARAPELAPGRYYLRLMVDDHPGVMAEVTGILGQNQISIASLIQHEPESEGDSQTVPLVIMSHLTHEGAIAKAVVQIDQLSSMMEGTVRMRVLD